MTGNQAVNLVERLNEQNAYLRARVEKYSSLLSEVLEADKNGELHRDPLDTDGLFNDIKQVLADERKESEG